MGTFLRTVLSGWLLLVVVTSMPQAKAAADNREQGRDQSREQGGRPPKIDIASALAVDIKTAQAVDQILHEQHEKHRAMGQDKEAVAMRAKHEALRAETDQKLAKYLTTAQIDKLHQLMPKPPRGGPPPGSPPDGPPPANSAPPPRY